jgi:hypothetical protein
MLQEFALGSFGPEATETQGIRDLYARLTATGGEIGDQEALKRVFFSWRSHEAESEDASEPVTRTYTMAPLFEAAGIRFYQAPDVAVPLSRGEVPEFGTVGGGYLLSNERNFRRYFEKVRNLGGVTIGLGSLQNLDLAVAAGSSGLILADLTPMVSMTLALLLPQLALNRTPFEFQAAGEAMVRRDAPAEPFLEHIPEDYRPAFEAHLTALRHSFPYPKMIRKLFMRSLTDPHSFMGNDAAYERAADLVARGGVSLVYGDFFGPDMPDLIELAMGVYEDPVRVIHVTNAPEQVVQRKYPVSADPFLRLLEASFVDPNGRLLLSTEFGNPSRGEDPFRYHAPPLRASAILLRAYGHLAPFVRRFEQSQGLV